MIPLNNEIKTLMEASFHGLGKRFFLLSFFPTLWIALFSIGLVVGGAPESELSWMKLRDFLYNFDYKEWAALFILIFIISFFIKILYERWYLFFTTSFSFVRDKIDISWSEKRYGLNMDIIWPRLYPCINRRLLILIEDARNQLDFSIHLILVFLICGLISLCLLCCHEGWRCLLFVISFLTMARLSYYAAIKAAEEYGDMIKISVDLHRFDMFNRLHLPLPDNLDEEKERNVALCRFLSDNDHPFHNFSYKHQK